MRISRVAVKNFANFQNVDFATDDSLVIVGENMVPALTSHDAARMRGPGIHPSLMALRNATSTRGRRLPPE